MDDDGELRALQAKAYGREGGLTAGEAVRLKELVAARGRSAPDDALTDTVVPATPTDGTDPIGSDEGARGSLTVETAVATARSDEAERTPTGDPQESAPSAVATSPVLALVRGNVKAVAAASLVLLFIGVAVGWAVFGRGSQASALTPAQQERRVELQSGAEYDAGSVRLIAEDDDALVWYGTRGDGEIACAVLDVGEASQDQCTRVDADDSQPLSVSVSVPVADPDDPAEEYGTSISATVGYSTTGEPLAWIYRWEMDDAMLGQFEGAERERAEDLVDEGFLPGLSIVGYFHDEPVWLVEKPADGTQTGGFVQCMVVDAANDATACRESDDQRTSLRALSLETADDGTPVLWTLQIRFTGWGSPYLTIEQGDPADVGISYLELGGEHGDPILVEVPSSETGG